jgi:hypothetical protein
MPVRKLSPCIKDALRRLEETFSLRRLDEQTNEVRQYQKLTYHRTGSCKGYASELVQPQYSCQATTNPNPDWLP